MIDGQIDFLTNVFGKEVVVDANSMEEAKKLIASPYYCQFKCIDIKKHLFEKCILFRIKDEDNK